MRFLPFIDDDVLIAEVGKILSSSKRRADRDLYKNVLDPFSALFSSFVGDISLGSWLDSEKSRQTQKTLQNKIGEFHQNILGSCYGWEVVDAIIDIKNDEKKIIAEIKNKHNTTKGSDKKVLYDNLSTFLDSDYQGYVGYYVEIIPRTSSRYNIPFVPSDNISRSQKPMREDVRKIDGASFYELATGYSGGLKMLYEVLPQVIGEISQSDFSNIKQDPLFKQLFHSTYK